MSEAYNFAMVPCVFKDRLQECFWQLCHSKYVTNFWDAEQQMQLPCVPL